MKTFKRGQSVVHLSHGVGTITGIEAREFSPGKVSKFYIITIEDNGAHKKVFVPFEATETRLRAVITKSEAKTVLSYINTAKPEVDEHQTWNRRYRDYMERIHTGAIMDVAQVYVALRALRASKDLSFGERKLAEQARTLLSKEFAAVGIAFPE